jgi:hypothetical protein
MLVSKMYWQMACAHQLVCNLCPHYPEKFRWSRDTTGIEISPKHEAAD